MKNLNIKNIIIILSFSIIIAFSLNIFSENPISLIGKQEIVIEKGKYNIEPITIEKAFEMLNTNGIVFIDAREKIEFLEGHIQGATNIPLYDYEKNNIQIKNMDKNNTLIIYCDDEQCGLSKMLAEKMVKDGFMKIKILTGGWSLWKDIGLPTNKG